MVRITITWSSFSGRPTIHATLRDKLGREPTNQELADDVRRILDESMVERAGDGKLRFQRGRDQP
jgi:hypothetical protein